MEIGKIEKILLPFKQALEEKWNIHAQLKDLNQVLDIPTLLPPKPPKSQLSSIQKALRDFKTVLKWNQRSLLKDQTCKSIIKIIKRDRPKHLQK